MYVIFQTPAQDYVTQPCARSNVSTPPPSSWRSRSVVVHWPQRRLSVLAGGNPASHVRPCTVRSMRSSVLMGPVGDLMDKVGWKNFTYVLLTHLPLDKMPAISQTIYSDAFSWMSSKNEKISILIQISLKFVLKGPIDKKNRVQLTKKQLWSR